MTVEDRSEESKERRKAVDICYALLTARARSRTELRDGLIRKGISAELAELVLDQFGRAGLIDDAVFADIWVRSRHQHRGLGRRALAQELRHKGVSDDIAANALQTIDSDAEEEKARELTRKKLRTMGSLDTATIIRRVVAALARKGYQEGLAYRIVRQEIAAQEDENTF